MAQAKVTVNKDGSWRVVIGHVMEPWEISELIGRFRKEFSSAVITETGSGVNISGEGKVTTRI